MEELKKNYRESLIKFKELKDLIQNKMGEITNKIEKFTEKKIKEFEEFFEELKKEKENKIPTSNNNENLVQKMLRLKEKLNELKNKIGKQEEKESIKGEIEKIKKEIEEIINNKAEEEKNIKSIFDSLAPPCITQLVKMKISKFEKYSKPSNISFYKYSWTLVLCCNNEMKNPKNVYLFINAQLNNEEITIYFEIQIQNKNKSKNLIIKEEGKLKDKKIFIDLKLTKEELMSNYVQSNDGENFVELKLTFKFDYYSNILGI